MKTTKVVSGIYKVEHNGKEFEIIKSIEQGYWKIYEMRDDGFGGKEGAWWDNRWTKKEALEYIKERF